MAKNDRNPNNNENDLFKSLTKLFSVQLLEEGHNQVDNSEEDT